MQKQDLLSISYDIYKSQMNEVDELLELLDLNDKDQYEKRLKRASLRLALLAFRLLEQEHSAYIAL